MNHNDHTPENQQPPIPHDPVGDYLDFLEEINQEVEQISDQEIDARARQLFGDFALHQEIAGGSQDDPGLGPRWDPDCLLSLPTGAGKLGLFGLGLKIVVAAQREADRVRRSARTKALAEATCIQVMAERRAAERMDAALTQAAHIVSEKRRAAETQAAHIRAQAERDASMRIKAARTQAAEIVAEARRTKSEALADAARLRAQAAREAQCGYVPFRAAGCIDDAVYPLASRNVRDLWDAAKHNWTDAFVCLDDLPGAALCQIKNDIMLHPASPSTAMAPSFELHDGSHRFGVALRLSRLFRRETRDSRPYSLPLPMGVFTIIWSNCGESVRVTDGRQPTDGNRMVHWSVPGTLSSLKRAVSVRTHTNDVGLIPAIACLAAGLDAPENGSEDSIPTEAAHLFVVASLLHHAADLSTPIPRTTRSSARRVTDSAKRKSHEPLSANQAKTFRYLFGPRQESEADRRPDTGQRPCLHGQ
ncbi:hypothetical protein ABZ897_41580 [Nonomuraea sp. NPDC046802]|uniref:hypothetical protein n=1 Tax=Nonomuraea sp. NPDC046802 TaxID=3154919 RepID=UPI0033F8D6C1